MWMKAVSDLMATEFKAKPLEHPGFQYLNFTDRATTFRIALLQAIRNLTMERPGNEAIYGFEYC